MTAPRGLKLFDRSLLLAHRTTAVAGEPAELWELQVTFRDDPAFVAMFADACTFLERFPLACTARVASAPGEHEAIVVAPPWIGIDVLVRIAARAPLAIDFVVGFLHALAVDFATLPPEVAVRTLDIPSLAITIAGRPRLLDLTLARYERRRAATQSGVIKGVFAFMSPEMVRGRDFDGRSDVFALALVAYELLGGMRVLKGTDFDVLEQVRDVRVPELRAWRPDAPAELARVIARMLEKDRDARITWAELAVELARFAPWDGDRMFEELRRIAPTEVEAAIVYGL